MPKNLFVSHLLFVSMGKDNHMTTSDQIKINSEHLLKKLAKLSESELSALVLHHNQKYFQANQPEITDEAFDKLVEALRFINPDAPALLEIGSKEVASEIIHQEPMLSLEKCYDDATFFKWAHKISGSFVAMPKIDGVACSITYSKQGKLIMASTRGDGRVGENITKNALLIGDLPKNLPTKALSTLGIQESCNIRGEVFLPLSTFKNRFAQEFSNPRNLAAGFLKLKIADEAKSNCLRFFPYDIRGTNLTTEQEKFELLDILGFSMMPWSMVTNDQEASKTYLNLLREREHYDFELDGVVFRANALTDQKRLGETAHHPRYAMAYKFHGESAPTKLIGVEWSVARSGSITPVALVEPVFVSGASITRASLHNLGIFNALDLREHSLVEINRRGGVIPHLERVLSSRGEKLLPPTQCPSCGGAVVAEGDFLRCQNPKGCENVAVSKLVHFCHVLGIDGLGEKIIRKLFNAGLLKSFADVFRLTPSMLLSLERMGDVLANKLVDEINSKRTISLAAFIKSLGINEVGSNVSELLANNWPTIEQIRALTLDDLLSVHGIGESIATSCIDGLSENAADIDDLLTEISIAEQTLQATNADTNHPLFNKSVVFTGKMAHLERKAAQEAVKKLGGKTPDALNKHVDYLVIGDEGSPLLGEGKKSTKHKQAEKFIGDSGTIRIISETDFMAMLSAK